MKTAAWISVPFYIGLAVWFGFQTGRPEEDEGWAFFGLMLASVSLALSAAAYIDGEMSRKKRDRQLCQLIGDPEFPQVKLGIAEDLARIERKLDHLRFQK